MTETLYSAIRDVPDFPTPGILYRDITPMLLDPDLFRVSVDALVAGVPGPVDRILAIESRGFLFGAALALELGAGLVPARKKGKLPWKTHSVEYTLEYGTDAIEIHQDAIEDGQRVLVVDDVLATGGTAAAAVEVVRRTGAEAVGISVLIELAALEGAARVSPIPVHSVLQYPRPEVGAT
jgi:adenine phosphoribosyltransferase